MYIGDHDRAIECLHRSMRLNPLDQRTIINAAYLAFAYFLKHQPEEGLRWAQRAVVLAPNPLSYRILTATLAEAGRIDEAREAATELLKLQPNSCLSRSRGARYRRREDLDLYVSALAKAGLPEEPTGKLTGCRATTTLTGVLPHAGMFPRRVVVASSVMLPSFRVASAAAMGPMTSALARSRLQTFRRRCTVRISLSG